MPLQQLAAIQVPEARQLLVKPHDRNSLGAIEKAIRDSDLGVSPTNDGVVIRLNFPPLTEERRRDYVKVVKHMAEDGRVAVRNMRRDARKHLEAAEKVGVISADELERAEKELEKITHDHVDRIDKRVRPQGTRTARGLSAGRAAPTEFVHDRREDWERTADDGRHLAAGS